eukprot:3629129-Rhodomonas_salina.1
MRTCVDETDSGLNGCCDKRKFGLPNVERIISEMGRGYVIFKMDLTYMFFTWKIHPSRWVLFGFQHPLTGQSYFYPVLPFGFTLSPPIACANTQLLADLIQEEARARVAGEKGCEALECVPRSALHGHVPPPRPQPAVSCYVDDYIDSCLGVDCATEIIAIAAKVFELAGA